MCIDWETNKKIRSSCSVETSTKRGLFIASILSFGLVVKGRKTRKSNCFFGKEPYNSSEHKLCERRLYFERQSTKKQITTRTGIFRRGKRYVFVATIRKTSPNKRQLFAMELIHLVSHSKSRRTFKGRETISECIHS